MNKVLHSGSHVHLCVALCACAVAVAIGGCGRRDSGPAQYNLSGAITFDGKPVPHGTITIAPDTSRGNSGRGAFAQIHDGRYQTTAGAGTMGGPHILTITGFEAIPGAEGVDPDDGLLFSSFEVSVDLPLEDTTHDIAVPASAASR